MLASFTFGLFPLLLQYTERVQTGALLQRLHVKQLPLALDLFLQQHSLHNLWAHLPAILLFALAHAVLSGITHAWATVMLGCRPDSLRERLKWGHSMSALANSLFATLLSYQQIRAHWGRSIIEDASQYCPEAMKILTMSLGYAIARASPPLTVHL